MQLFDHKLNVSKIATSLILLFIFAGCATYRVGNETFNSPEAALAAKKNSLDEIKTQIQPVEKKRGGSAAIIIPTFETFVALGVKKTGNPQKELIDYVGNYLVTDFRAMSVFLDKRQIFDKVTLIEDNFPIPMAKKVIPEYDAVIYLNLAGPEQFQWFMRVAPNYENMTLDMDKSKPIGLQRVLSWLDNIEKKLSDSSYKPKR